MERGPNIMIQHVVLFVILLLCITREAVTIIPFGLPSRLFVSLKVFDAVGREVSTIVSEELASGSHVRRWNAAGFPSGVYFCRLQAGLFTETRKLLLLR
jgi:hypothetical protein